jgi:hypothetical protein
LGNSACAHGRLDEHVSDDGPFERIKNATISWNYHPTSAERAPVMSALR